MTRSNRIVLLGLAALVLVVAVVAIGSKGDDKGATSSPSTADNSKSSADGPSTPGAKPTPKPPVQVVVKGKKPVGGVKVIEVKEGDRVRFNVTSDETENVHLHGYDVEKPVGPGKPAKYDFKATIGGVFEVELEGSAVQIVSLRVNP